MCFKQIYMTLKNHGSINMKVGKPSLKGEKKELSCTKNKRIMFLKEKLIFYTGAKTDKLMEKRF